VKFMPESTPPPPAYNYLPPPQGVPIPGAGPVAGDTEATGAASKGGSQQTAKTFGNLNTDIHSVV